SAQIVLRCDSTCFARPANRFKASLRCMAMRDNSSEPHYRPRSSCWFTAARFPNMNHTMIDTQTQPLLDPEFLAPLEPLELVFGEILLGRKKDEGLSDHKGHSIECCDYRYSSKRLSKLSTSWRVRKRENSSAPWPSASIAQTLSTCLNTHRTRSPLAAV